MTVQQVTPTSPKTDSDQVNMIHGMINNTSTYIDHSQKAMHDLERKDRQKRVDESGTVLYMVPGSGAMNCRDTVEAWNGLKSDEMVRSICRDHLHRINRVAGNFVVRTYDLDDRRKESIQVWEELVLRGDVRQLFAVMHNGMNDYSTHPDDQQEIRRAICKLVYDLRLEVNSDSWAKEGLWPRD